MDALDWLGLVGTAAGIFAGIAANLDRRDSKIGNHVPARVIHKSIDTATITARVQEKKRTFDPDTYGSPNFNIGDFFPRETWRPIRLTDQNSFVNANLIPSDAFLFLKKPVVSSHQSEAILIAKISVPVSQVELFASKHYGSIDASFSD
jgi:hypothetical protein